MRKLLVILLVSQLFLFYSYAGVGQEEDGAKVVVINPDDTNMIYDWPLWLFNHGYTSSYDSSWIYNHRYSRGNGAIVLRKPPSFSESFLIGLSRGLSKSTDYYYRDREQRQYTKATMALIKLKWASEGYRSKPKYSQPQRYFVPEREDPALWLERQKKKERRTDDIIEFAGSEGWVFEWQYRTMKLNEYLKSRGLSPVPINVDVNQVFDGEWIIYWDGEKWGRKKK